MFEFNLRTNIAKLIETKRLSRKLNDNIEKVNEAGIFYANNLLEKITRQARRVEKISQRHSREVDVHST